MKNLNACFEQVMGKHSLIAHIRALRRYLLLEQGDFIHALLEALSEELDKNAKYLYLHNLVNHLRTAELASQARYEQSDLLDRLDVKLLTVRYDEEVQAIFAVSSFYHFLRSSFAMSKVALQRDASHIVDLLAIK